MVCFEAAAGGDGAEKSKRSAMPELVLVLGIMVDIPGAESNAPKPLEELNVRDGCGGDC